MDAFRDLCGELGETANAYACPLLAARALVGEAARAFVAEQRKGKRVSTETLFLDTSELRAGDVVCTHGIRALLEGEPNTFTSGNSGTIRAVYAWQARVINLDDVKRDGLVPLGWLYPDVWGKGERGGWGKDWNAVPTWTIQGNDLARWSVERESEGAE